MRTRLMVLLGCQEGLRCGEIAALETGDLDLPNRTMLITGKGGHQRYLPISDETFEVLTQHLAALPRGMGPVIRSLKYGADPYAGIQPATISALLSRLMHEAGVPASGHALRHTMANDALRSGANIREVQLALGHASLETTQHYLGLSSVKDLRKALGGRRYGHSTSEAAATG